MPDLEALAGRAEALTEEVAGLRQALDRNSERVDGLRTDLTAMSDRQSATERRGAFVAITLIVAIVLTFLIGVTAWRGIITDRRVDAICPVLALVIGGYDPLTRPEGPARETYVQSFDVMRRSYAQLGCTQAIVPPRKTN